MQTTYTNLFLQTPCPPECFYLFFIIIIVIFLPETRLKLHQDMNHTTLKKEEEEQFILTFKTENHFPIKSRPDIILNTPPSTVCTVYPQTMTNRYNQTNTNNS